MNLLVKLSVVPIFFLPLTAGWAGTQEDAKLIEQPSVKTTEPISGVRGRGRRCHLPQVRRRRASEGIDRFQRLGNTKSGSCITPVERAVSGSWNKTKWQRDRSSW